MNYKLSYDFNKDENCGVINFNDKQLLIDFEDLFKIINYNKTFTRLTDDCDYPYYMRNKQKISYLQFLFNFNDTNIQYIFKNENKYDLRRKNINILHKFHNQIKDKYEIIEYNLGHYATNGKTAYAVKNPMWKIKENNKEIWLMYCEPNSICKLCDVSCKKILDFEKNNYESKKLTFYKHSNGYVTTHYKNLYIHQIITSHYGNGKGTKNLSVDHIDQDPLNNTFDNLRIATRKQQEQNSNGIKAGTKRKRKKTAKPLPDGLTQDMIPKYVVYYKDCYNKEKQLFREFFKIEKHPKIKKPINSSKSKKFTILQKLEEIKKKIYNIENNIEEPKKEVPQYYSIQNFRNAPHFTYDRRLNNKRFNLRMIINENKTIQEELERFNGKLYKKYPELVSK